MPTQEERTIGVTMGSVDSLTLYEVTEDELSLLEHGPLSTVYLNFAIGLLTLSASFFTTIFTVDLTPTIVKFIVFLTVSIISLIIGIISLVLWYRSDRTYKSLIVKIKKRTEKRVVLDDPSTPDAITVATETTTTVALQNSN